MSQLKVFISYAREDLSEVFSIKEVLVQNDISPWLDVDRILPGEKWDLKIREGLEEADFVIICLSRNSVNKRGYLQREARLVFSALEEFLDDDIYIIPILLEPCDVPLKFKEYQWLSKFHPGWELQLIKSIEEGTQRRGIKYDSEKKISSVHEKPVDLADLGGGNLFSSLSLRKLFRGK